MQAIHQQHKGLQPTPLLLAGSRQRPSLVARDSESSLGAALGSALNPAVTADLEPIGPLTPYAEAMQQLQQLEGALLQRYHWIVALICRVGGSELDDQAAPARPLFGEMCQPLALRALQRDFQHLEVRWDELLRCASPVSGRPYAEQMATLRTLSDSYITHAEALRQRCRLELRLHDPLTGTLNPLWLEGALQVERERSERAGLPCVLLLADHDHVERMQTPWGPLVGDLVLAHVSRLLREDLRHTDFLFRRGHAQWLILLPCIEPEQAQRVQRRLQHRIEALPLDFGGGQRIALRLSTAQAASLPGEDLDSWLERADTGLRQNRDTPTATPSTR